VLVDLFEHITVALEQACLHGSLAREERRYGRRRHKPWWGFRLLTVARARAIATAGAHVDYETSPQHTRPLLQTTTGMDATAVDLDRT
jgi:hypothetical protein